MEATGGGEGGGGVGGGGDMGGGYPRRKRSRPAESAAREKEAIHLIHNPNPTLTLTLTLP